MSCFWEELSSRLVLDQSGFLIINPIGWSLFLKNSWAFQVLSIYISLCTTEQKEFWNNVRRDDDNFSAEVCGRGIAGHDAAAQATGLVVGLSASIGTEWNGFHLFHGLKMKKMQNVGLTEGTLRVEGPPCGTVALHRYTEWWSMQIFV